jgi:hypothetical protein
VAKEAETERDSGKAVLGTIEEKIRASRLLINVDCLRNLYALPNLLLVPSMR